MDFALCPADPDFERFCDAGGFVVDQRHQNQARDFFRAMDLAGCDLKLLKSLLEMEPLLGRVFFLPPNDLHGSALHLAAARGDVALTRVLLPFSDATATDELLSTPFDIALSAGHEAVAELIFAFLPADFVDRSGRNPSLMAAAAGAITLLRETLKTCDPRQSDNSGFDALTLAACAGSVGCVSLLLDFCDPLAANRLGLSALDNAILMRHLDVVRVLLPRSDTSAGLRSPLGRDALMSAAFHSFHEAIPLLLPASDLSLRSSEGLTAFDIALADGTPQVIDAFEAALSPSDLRRAMAVAQELRFELPRVRARFEAMELGDALSEAVASLGAQEPAARSGASDDAQGHERLAASARRKPRAL